MSLSNHVIISITSNTVGISRLGFGTALILSHNASFAGLSKSYASALEVSSDFATDSPEYLTATALFSQNPRPQTCKIGKAPTAPTAVYEIIPSAANDTEYTIKVKGEGVTATTCTYTSDATALVSEITAGLTSLLNAVAGKNFTAVDNTTSITITGTAAGDWFSMEVTDPALLDCEMTHADPGLATDLNALIVQDNSWYCLLTMYNSGAYVKAAAAWVESNKKIYVVDMPETDIVTEASTGSACTADDLATLARARTMLAYHPAPDQMMGAAWAGKMLPLDPGSGSWKFKTLSGVAAVSLTTTQRANLVAKNANSYEEVVDGLSITFEGTTCDGDFMDVQRGLDWLENDMQSAVMEVLASNAKVGYDNAGIALVQGAMEGSLRRAVSRKILVDDDTLLVTTPALADISVANKTARTLPDMDFSGTLVGAIHKVTLTGTVSV